MSAFPPNFSLPPDPDAGGTRLESIDDIRKALENRQMPTQSEAPSEPETIDFRPTRRPPMAMLCVLDDGRHDGPWHRLYQDVTVIGRTEGDILVPHDSQISSRHLAVARVTGPNRYRWYLTDLESTNGSFVRISKTIIASGQEFMIGAHRFRFDATMPGSAPGAEDSSQGTRGWGTVQATDLLPSLVEMKPQGEGQRLFLKADDNWIGRDANSCTVVLANDLLASPRHARLYRDAKGTWMLENAGSRNGTWLRIKKLPIGPFAQFQLGEQRFLFKVLK
jgi:pSer/pThr/pTyr-binding forkhead associated (FHA) protein